VIETIYRLVITGVLVVVAQGSAVQIIVGTMVVLFYLKVCDIFQPYEDPKVQILRDICQWQIFFVFFLALILKANFSSIDTIALDVLLILAITANLVLDILQLGWSRYVAWNNTSNSSCSSSVVSTLPVLTVVSPFVKNTTTATTTTEVDDFSKDERDELTEQSIEMIDLAATTHTTTCTQPTASF
jgi:hypothetical protein